VLQVLVDADNVPPARLRELAAALTDVASIDRRVVVAGHPDVLAEVTWPSDATVLAASGWQRADVALAAAYLPEPGPLVLASGDGDFVHLVSRHPGPVLVISEAPAGAFRDVASVVDPAHDGPTAIPDWLRAVLD